MKAIKRLIALFIVVPFISTSIMPAARAADMPWMPQPGTMVDLSPAFMPAVIKGITIHPDNPLKFDFIIHKGDQNLSGAEKQDTYKKLIKYFLASLAVPDENQWVNLSPYEKNRIIEEDFGKTEMGRDLLAQDYLLKQITSSLIYPEKGIGKDFWDKVFKEAFEKYGTTDVPVDTFNKVWILPDDALIYEKGNTAYVLKNHLKVMLEEDYIALQHNALAGTQVADEKQDTKELSALSSKVLREIIIPALEKEVNEGKNFAQLRQVYSGMILAAWYKRALKESLLGQIYADKAKVKGVDQDPKNNQEIYQQYVQAYKKGVYNYIKEDVDRYTKEVVPRKYFSGGTEGYKKQFPNGIPVTQNDAVGKPVVANDAPAEEVVATAMEEQLVAQAAVEVKASNVNAAQLSVQEAEAQLENFLRGENGYRLSSKVGEDRLAKAKPIAVELLRELSGKPLDYKVFDTTFTKGDITSQAEVDLTKMRDQVGRVEISTFTQIVYLRMLGIAERPAIDAAMEVQSQQALVDRVANGAPARHSFIKDQPIAGFVITSDRFEDIPEQIRRHMGAVDQTKYTPEYLRENIGSMIALQMNGDQPDFYIVGKDTFKNKYKVVGVGEVATKNKKVFGKLSAVEGVGDLLASGNQGVIGALKTAPVEMIKMSEIGYPVEEDITIQSPWGEQTKPAGKDAFLVFDTSNNQYYMVNADADGNPISYVKKDAAMNVQSQKDMTDRITEKAPQKYTFVKDAPILGYQIASDRFEDIPEQIRRHIGAVDQTKYTPEYLRQNIGSMIALQMNGDQPDFYIVGKDTFDKKYKVVAAEEVGQKNKKMYGKLSAVEGMGDLLTSGNKGLIGALKTVPVEMIKMSDLGYATGEEVTIQSPWGEQTKPAGQDAFLVFDTSNNQYYMVNSDAKGNPISYVDAAMDVQSQEVLVNNISQNTPKRYNFVKDAPIAGYQITSDRFEDIPEQIRRHMGAVDQTKYTPEYLRENIGSMIALQMNGDQPDFYIVGKPTFDAKYKVVGVAEVGQKNKKMYGKLSAVEGIGDLLTSGTKGIIGALKTVPVEMIKMSEIGYAVPEEVTIQSPWGEQTKPAGQDAFLVFDTSNNQYYMVNADAEGNPISYVKKDAAMNVQTQKDLTDRITQSAPQKHNFIKDAPIAGYQITSDRFEDIPEQIRRHIGAVDQTKYTPEYLRQNIGSMIALQMNGDQPDFYIVGKDTFDKKYKVVGIEEVGQKNKKMYGKLSAVEGVADLLTSGNKGIIGALKTAPVEMVKMSEIGYSVAEEAVIQSPWGEQTKPAGQDAFLVFDTGANQYYMVNSDANGNPISYVTVDNATKADPLGGIDFNSANLNLQIKRDGKGVPLPISQQNFENIHIDGLVPIILNIQPATAVLNLS